MDLIYKIKLCFHTKCFRGRYIIPFVNIFENSVFFIFINYNFYFSKINGGKLSEQNKETLAEFSCMAFIKLLSIKPNKVKYYWIHFSQN